MSKPIHFTGNSSLLPVIRQKVDKLRETLINDKLTPWRWFNFRIVNITDFYGKPIALGGEGTFYGLGTEVLVFFSFIKPFLQDAIVKILDDTIETCRVRRLKPVEPYIREAAMILEGHLIYPIYDEIVDIDRHLRGKGYPKSVGKRNVVEESAEMRKNLDERKNEMIRGINEQNKLSGKRAGNMSKKQNRIPSPDKDVPIIIDPALDILLEEYDKLVGKDPKTGQMKYISGYCYTLKQKIEALKKLMPQFKHAWYFPHKGDTANRERFYWPIRERLNKLAEKYGLTAPPETIPALDGWIIENKEAINAEVDTTDRSNANVKQQKDEETNTEQENARRPKGKRVKIPRGFMGIEQLCEQFSVPDRKKQAFRKRLERFRKKNALNPNAITESQNKGFRQSKYLYNASMVADIAKQVKECSASLKRPSQKKLKKN